jgi:hypothetical protein
MTLVDLTNLKTMICNGSIGADEREWFRELLYLILTKAARVDLHADESEVSTIKRIMKEYTGEDYDEGDIRAEAIAQSRENSLRPVAKLGSRLPETYCVLAIQALEEVMRADDNVSYAEIDYFNAVASAMRLSFADVAGLIQD